jgi:hypothetical protein
MALVVINIADLIEEYWASKGLTGPEVPELLEVDDHLRELVAPIRNGIIQPLNSKAPPMPQEKPPRAKRHSGASTAVVPESIVDQAWPLFEQYPMKVVARKLYVVPDTLARSMKREDLARYYRIIKDKDSRNGKKGGPRARAKVLSHQRQETPEAVLKVTRRLKDLTPEEVAALQAKLHRRA